MAVEQKYEYEKALDNYQNKLSEYQDKYERITNAGSLEDQFRTSADVIGTPVAIELLKHGLKKRFSKGMQQLNQKIDELSDKAKAKSKSVVDDIQQRAQDQIDDATERLQEQSGEVQDAVDQAYSRPDFMEGNELAAFRSRVGNFGRDTDIQMEDFSIEPQFPDELVEPEVPRITIGLPAGKQSYADLHDSEFADEDWDYTPRNLTRTLTRPAEETGGLRGDSTLARVLGRRTQVPMEEEMPMPAPRVMPVEVSAQQEAESAGSRVEQEVQSNIEATERVTGLTGQVAAEEAESGVNIAAESGEVGGDVAEGLESAAEVAASTGAETEGLGEVAAGVLAIGGVLASIFAPHHKDTPPPPPNLSHPSLQPGLGN